MKAASLSLAWSAAQAISYVKLKLEELLEFILIIRSYFWAIQKSHGVLEVGYE